MKQAENAIRARLHNRIQENTFRSLSNSRLPVDFASNDYLGFSASTTLHAAIQEATKHIPEKLHGSGGSRLLTGNSILAEKVEIQIAKFHKAAAGLLFNSGYDANIGLLSSIAQRGDTILSDELIHASLIDGIRLSHATRSKFKHNDLKALNEKLSQAHGNIYVVVESVYSMDGDIAPIAEMLELCKKYDAALIVDEAHATGVIGDYGEGLVAALGAENDVFARIVTFGKAMGCHGAIVLGSSELRKFLINFARSFIYTTALPASAIVAISEAYKALDPGVVAIIRDKINYFDNLTGITSEFSSAIKTVRYTSTTDAKAVANNLQERGLDVRAIVSPTVAAGTERIRICLHAYNTELEIKALVSAIEDQKNG